jgi:hypothetical protein
MQASAVCVFRVAPVHARTQFVVQRQQERIRYWMGRTELALHGVGHEGTLGRKPWHEASIASLSGWLERRGFLPLRDVIDLCVQVE